jgi:hypothetical protein
MAQKKIHENDGSLTNRIDWLRGIYQDWQATRMPTELYETYEYAYEEYEDADLEDVILN